MPGEGVASQRLARGRSAEPQQDDAWELLAALAEQWRSMATMAAMFIITIALAMLIQPTYDHDELRAFGAEGATKAGFVLLEGVMILVFTFAIIWLAKKNMQRLIQVAMWGVLWIALVYTLVPLAHMVLTPEPAGMQPTEVTGGSTMLATTDGGETIIGLGPDGVMAMQGAGTASGANGGAEVLWTTNVTPEDGVGGGAFNIVMQQDDFVLCEGTMWMRFDLASGEVLENHSDDCRLGLTVPGEPGEDDVAWSIIFDNILTRVDRFHPNNPAEDWRWKMPSSFDGRDIILAEKIGDDHFLVVTGSLAVVVEVPGDRHPNDPQDPLPYVYTTWEMIPASGERFIAATFGHPVGHAVNETSDVRAFFIGSSGSSVQGFTVQLTNGSVTVDSNAALFDERGAFEGPIRGLLLADCCNGGSQDLWVIDGQDVEVYMGHSLVDRSREMLVAGDQPVNLALSPSINPDWQDRGLTDGVIVIETVPMNVDATWTKGVWVMPAREDVIIGGVPLMWADVIGVLLSVALLVALIFHPEWYLVNLFGILVGAGVSTMLGVSFVPWLVIIFMIGMAFYDHWAVNKSKHMLDLADTMIELRLPILLVAPKDRNYSFRAEGGDVMSDRAAVLQGTPEVAAPQGGRVEAGEPEAGAPEAGALSGQETSMDSSGEALAADRFEGMQQTVMSEHAEESEGGAEAMFMGLGDVIFPGILVISALTWLPEGTSMLGYGDGPMMVAIGTLIGGLFGYLALMTQVARGKPQAGLPLLNGGSILGYLLSALLFIGPSALVFNISFF